MSTVLHEGYLVVGDISGYTSYVAQTELEHSQAVLSELLELIVDRVRPVLRIVRLEGDAVFCYAPGDHMPRGESLLELVETTYVAFRGRVDGIVRHTTCDCNACRAIPSLDLKFVLHYGDYAIQRVAGISELVGTDVNLLHRLTKNHVTQNTGWQAYALFTEHCLRRVGLDPDGFHEQVEAYDHLGEVKTYCLNLHQRFKELMESRHHFISPEQADMKLVFDFTVPPPVVWEWVTDPAKRNLYQPQNNWSAVIRPGGRTAVGARNHCAHGKDSVDVETVLDWHPYEYFTVDRRSHLQKENFMDRIETYSFEPLANGTSTRLHLNLKLQRPSLLGRLLSVLAGRLYLAKKYADVDEMMRAELEDREQEVELLEAAVPGTSESESTKQ